MQMFMKQHNQDHVDIWDTYDVNKLILLVIHYYVH